MKLKVKSTMNGKLKKKILTNLILRTVETTGIVEIVKE